jgi:dienelactone hydrolase
MKAIFKLVSRERFIFVIAAALFLRASDAQVASGVTGNVHTVRCQRFGRETNAPLLILLHGVSGPSPFYTQQAEFFADHGFRVVLPHYLEASHGSASTDEHYENWVAAVRNVMSESNAQIEGRPVHTVIVGYSLGASIALALGSQGEGPDAIAELYGSLPDKYFRDLRGMPPLLILHGERDTNIPVNNAIQLAKLCAAAHFTCETHIYPGEGHGFTSQSLRDADQRILQFFAKVVSVGSTP